MCVYSRVCVRVGVCVCECVCVCVCVGACFPKLFLVLEDLGMKMNTFQRT